MRADRLIVKYKANNGAGEEELVRCTVEKWQWYGKYMGEQYVSFTIQSEKPIPFAVGDFCEYRGQVYTLNYVPSVKQQGNIGGTGNAFVYDSVKMDSCRDELGRTIMLDITPTTGDYEAYKGTNYTGSAVFSLYCGESTFNGRTLTPVCALAAKMQANMDRAYPAAGWKFHVDTESTHEESGKQVLNTHTDEKALSFNNTTVAAALAMVKDTFDINFVIIGRDVYIGYPFNALSSGDDGEYFYFGYGKGYADMDNQGKALFQLQRTSNSSQKIVTRLRALGSTKNLPYRYYNKKYNLSQTLFPLNLQLPDTFLPPEAKKANNVERRKIYPFLRNVLGDTNDAYIDKNDDCMSTAEGLREECARWDGSNSELEEIYPTIYEATYGELRAANCEDMDGTKGSSAFPNYLDDERIDEILAVDDDANVGDGIMSETNISNETKRESAVNVERSESQATLSYNGKGYQSNEVSVLTATGQYAGTYNISASHVYFGAMYLLGRHQSENITKQCNVKYVLRVYATDVLTKEKKEIYKFESEAKKLTNRDGVYKEIEFVKVPNYKGGEDKKITITSLSDIDVTIQLQVTDLDWSYDQYSISWYLNNSKYEEVDTETEWTSALIWDRENSASTFMDSPFHVIVKDMGFDFVAAFGTSETPRLSMKSGACVAREFEIANNPEKVEYEKNGKIYKAWKLTLKRCPDKTIYTYYPSAVNKLQEGDNFVLLNIEMPEVYILAAEVKLLVEATKYLADNCDTKFDYQPSIDDIYLQRNYDLCEKENRIEDSIYWKLYDGVTFPFYGIPEDVDDDKPLLNVVIDTITIKEGEGLTPKVDIKLTDEATQGTIQKLSQTVSNITSGSIFNAAQNAAGGGSVDTSSIKSLISQYGSKNFLSKTKSDTAQGLITFIQGLVSEGKITAKQGVEIGSFVTGLIGGTGARIDKDGNGEMESLVIRQFLEVPELRFNRIDVVSGELWNSICFGTIEAVDTKKRIVTLKLQDGELSGIEVGDICRGVFHCLESSNPSADMAEDECGFQQMAGFSTSYFTPTEVYDDGARFKYSLRSGTSVHPQVGMKFAVYGSFTNSARRASAYHTRTYTRYLNAVDTWRISPDKNIYGQQGNLEGLTINEMEMHGYGGYFHNIYMSGVHVEFDRDWLDHNLPKVYSVHLTTYEHTIVTDIEGNPLNGLEELRNVITGESNVMSGDDNVIATRLAVTTTILAHKGTTPLLYSDAMDEGRFIVTLACVGCTAEVDNGVVKVTSIDKESAEHRVDISVNCEGEGVYVQTFNIPVVKQGENGITADLDNEMASIAANDKGEPLVVPFEEIVSNGRMWYGNDPMYLTSAEVAVPGGITVEIAKTETDSEGNHSYLPIDSEHKQCTLRITKVDASAADTNEIRISLTGRVKQELNTEYTKTVVFKLNKVRMGENALNYSLMVSTPQMQVDGKGNFTTAGVSCSVIGSDGKTLKELTSSELASAGLALNVQLYNGTSDYSAEQAYTYQSTLGNGSSIGGYTLTKDSVRLVFYLYWNDIIIDKEGVPIIKDGSSTVRIDLDNENDSILYNENGSKVSESCVTNISVYDGSNNVTSQCTLGIDSYSGVTCSINGTRCTVSDVSSASGWVKLWAYYPADGNYYYAIFSIKRLVGEDKYDIVTIPSSVVYDPNNKAYSERYPDVYVYRTDQQGNRTSVGGSLSSYGLKLQYSYNGSSWYTVSNGYVTADYQNPNIYLRLTDSNGYVRDSETIPVVIGGLNGCFKSIVFKRTNTKPDTPVGGSFSDPKPSGWEDGIPAGDEILWSSSCIFYADGSSSGWTEPRQMTDTATYDVEFSPYDCEDVGDLVAITDSSLANSGTIPTPTTNKWFDPVRNSEADFTSMIWRAERHCKNGEWSDWAISKIKGEAGKDSTSYWFVCQTNSFNLSQTGSVTPANVKVTMKKKTGEGNVEDCSDYYLSVWEVTSSGTNRKSSAKASSVTVYAPSSSAQRVEVIATTSYADSYPSTTNIIAQYSFSINKDGANGDTGDTVFLTPKGIYSPSETYKFTKKNGATAYERDYVLYSSDGGSYKTYAVKNMGDSFYGKTPTDSDYWEELSKYQSVLADTIIGTNCNLGGFMVSNQEMKSESFEGGKGIYVNGKVGKIIIKQSEGWQWRVDETGMMTAGIESGQRVVINPSTKDISLYDANGNVVTTISGETISTISSLFGTSGTLTTNNLSTLSISGDGHSINSTTTTKIMVSSFSASAGSVVKASLYVGLFASAYSASSSSTIQAPGNNISAKLILVNSSNTKIGNISNTISAFGDTVNESNSGTLSGSITIPSSGYYYIKLEISYIVGQHQSNYVQLSSVYSASAQLISNTYLSRLLANGFCFGSNSANFIAALNESGNMHFNFTAGATNLEMTTSKFNLQSQYGKVFPVILYAACRIESSTEYGIGTYYSADGVKPTLTRTSTGQYKLNYSSGLPLLTTGNAIITVTPYTQATVIANLGSLSTTSRSLPIYLYNINGSSQDAYFFVRVEYIG